MKHRFGLVACARWETGYIVEWLNYHRLLGYDHVFLYCNDDDPAELYERVLPFLLGPQPFVTFRHHREQGQQYQMYQHFLRHHLDDCEWISFIDIDEFIRLPAGETIGDFLGRFGEDVDCMMFNWAFFGPNGHKTPPPGNVLQNFTRREAELSPNTKYVLRGRAMSRAWLGDEAPETVFWHTPEDRLLPGAKLRNVLGEDMGAYQAGFPDAAKAFVNQPSRRARILQTAVVQHYGLRSERAFHERVERGLGGMFAGQTVWREVANRENFAAFLDQVNAVRDDALAGFWAAVAAQARRLTTDVTAPTTPTTPAAGRVNLARGKAATQSSISEWSKGATPARDAAGAVDGCIDGLRKFHTAFERDPWWQVDLGAPLAIGEIRIYNTTEAVARDRFARFKLAIAFDPGDWIEVFAKHDDTAVGADGAPFIWKPTLPAFSRYVRVTALGQGYLHLDQVEVYGP